MSLGSARSTELCLKTCNLVALWRSDGIKETLLATSSQSLASVLRHRPVRLRRHQLKVCIVMCSGMCTALFAALLSHNLFHFDVVYSLIIVRQPCPNYSQTPGSETCVSSCTSFLVCLVQQKVATSPFCVDLCVEASATRRGC